MRQKKGENREPGLFPPLTVTLPAHVQDGSCKEFRHTLYLLVQAATQLAEIRSAFAKEIALTPNQFLILMCVAYQADADGISIAAIATELGLASTHVTTDVRRMTTIGLVEKRPNEHDKRGVLVTLTQEGRTAVTNVAPIVQQINDILFLDVTSEEREALAAVSTKLIRNSQRAKAELSIRNM